MTHINKPLRYSIIPTCEGVLRSVRELMDLTNKVENIIVQSNPHLHEKVNQNDIFMSRDAF